MRERIFLGASILAGIALVGVIGIVMKGLLYIYSHVTIVWL